MTTTLELAASNKHRTTAAHLAVLFFVCVGLPLTLAASTGSLAIPHCDSWAHSKIATVFYESGEIRLTGLNRTGLMGQILVLGPFGRSVLSQQLFVALLALAGLAAVVVHLKSTRQWRSAVLGAWIVGLLPFFGTLATSFMSDVPAFTAAMLCLVAGERAIRAADVRWLLLACVLGLWGASIREQSIFALAAVLVIYGWSHWAQAGRLLVVAVASMGALLAFEAWRRSLPYSDNPTLVLSPRVLLSGTVRAALTASLLVSPAVLLQARPQEWSHRRRTAAFVAVGAAVGWCVATGQGLAGDYLQPSGSYSGMAVGAATRSILPAWLWIALTALACVSFGGAVGTVTRTRIQSDPLSATAAALFALGSMTQMALGQPFFDRYLLLVVPPLLRLLLPFTIDPRSTRFRLCALPVLGLLAVTASLLVSSSLAFDAARWQAAEHLVAQGVSARDINPGKEWVGYHSRSAATVTVGLSDPPQLGGALNLFPDTRSCYIVSAARLPGLTLLEKGDFRTYALLGRSTIYVYRDSAC